MSKYGLLGEKLSHSFSKIIHERLASYSYDLLPMSKDELHRFLTEKSFSAVNVTIPYKQEVIPFLDFVDEKAKAIGAVNTIVNREGRLFGYNTDFDGFLYNLEKNGISLKDKNIMILGSGGTRKTVGAVCEFCGAKSVVTVGRTKKEGVITYEEAYSLFETEVIINATPCGMFPNNGDCPIDITKFPKLYAVVDVIYNPLRTNLILNAKKAGLKYAGGLLMLVAQAKYAVEHFLGVQIPDRKIDGVYDEILRMQSNLVLIGMPSSGKTTIGKMLGEEMNKSFSDIDFLIEEKEQRKIADIFKENGEEFFRELEKETTAEISKKNGQIISTGGGVVKNEENVKNLSQNGVVCFLDRKIENLTATSDRPLSSRTDDLIKLYEERYPLYSEFCDFRVANDKTEKEAVDLIKEKYNEAVSN